MQCIASNIKTSTYKYMQDNDYYKTGCALPSSFIGYICLVALSFQEEERKRGKEEEIMPIHIN